MAPPVKPAKMNWSKSGRLVMSFPEQAREDLVPRGRSTSKNRKYLKLPVFGKEKGGAMVGLGHLGGGGGGILAVSGDQ
jgi:hypothetical protein